MRGFLSPFVAGPFTGNKCLLSSLDVGGGGLLQLIKAGGGT